MRTLTIFGLTLMLAHASPTFAQLNVTVAGALGDLDNNNDNGAGEAAVLQSAVACWAVRVGTNRNFTLNVMTGALTGGTIGQGTVTSNTNIPTTGRITMDNDGSTVYFVDATPLVSTEFQPDPNTQWRFVNGGGAAAQTDLFSVVTHEIGHALGWVCGQITGAAVTCGFFNPNYDGLMSPTPANFVNGTTVNLVAGGAHPLNVPLRGDGLGTQNQVVNELSHPGAVGDLMRGFYTSGTRETQSQNNVDMFAHAYGDNVNMPPFVSAGNNVVSECNAVGGSNLTLTGAGTTDPENDALTFNWTCPSISLSAPNTASPGGFFPLDTTTTCRLDVGDLNACPAVSATVDVEVRDTTDPMINCPAPITVECTAPGGTPKSNSAIAAFLAGASATDVCDSTLTIGNDAPSFFTLGSTDVLFSTADQSSNAASCPAAVEVVDTTPPTIGNATATPATLWAPNHHMIPVTVSVDVSDVCSSTTCTIVSVTSNQPINGIGDGNTTPDWVITGPLTVDLRAERGGNMTTPRLYTLTVNCGDGSGNSSTKMVNVSVSHDQR